MAHVTIPVSTSAPVSGMSHDDRSKLLSPQLKYGSLKYADVSKVEVLDVNENFTEAKDNSRTYIYSPDFKTGDTRHLDLNDSIEPDAELDTSHFTATTDNSSPADHSSFSEESFDKASTSDNLDLSSRGRNPNIPEYSLSPEKSIFTIDGLEENDNQPSVNDITSDWDVTNPNNTPTASPVKSKAPEQTPINTSAIHTPINSTIAHTPTSGSRTKSISELERVVSDAVRNILDSSSINSGEISPQTVAPLSSPAAVADTTTESTVDREGPTEIPPKLLESAVSELNASKTVARQATYEESELEKAVEVNPTTEQELIYSVFNDEEAANCLISDAILAESIVALSSIPTATTSTISAPSPAHIAGSFSVTEEIIEETSFELRAEQQAHQQAEFEGERETEPSPDRFCQFNYSMTEIEVDGETKVALSEKSLHSDVFVYVSDSELDPKQNLQSEMDAASDSLSDQPAEEKTDADASSNRKETERKDSMNGAVEDQQSNQPVNRTTEQKNGTVEYSNEAKQSTSVSPEDAQQVNDNPDISDRETGQENDLIENGAFNQDEGNTNGRSPTEGEEQLFNGETEVAILRRPDGASETEQGPGSDLESTQDMTDAEEDLRKTSEEIAKKQILNALRKRSSQSRTEGFSENSIEDLRQAVMTREAVIALADRGMKHSPSDAVLQYQERKSKYDVRQDQLKITPNGTLIGALEPRPTLPTHQTRPLIGFKPGRAISIEGIVNKPAQSFSISLQTAELAETADVAMFISPSFTDKSILCNTYCHDTWGAPQIFDKKFPFTKGKKFEIKIATDTHCFKIFVNGQRLLDYDHRMPVERVRHLRLEGDCVFNNVECPFVLDLPYVLDVDHGFRESSGVMLDAFVWPKAKMFELNLLCGEKARQTHASFMMKVNFLEDDLVRVEMASFCNDRIGEQSMVEGDLNIHPGQDFKLRIITLEKSFSMEVDGVELADYDHKLPIDKLGHVLIEGDISLYAVKFMRPNRRVSSGLVLSTVYHDDRCCQCSIT